MEVFLGLDSSFSLPEIPDFALTAILSSLFEREIPQWEKQDSNLRKQSCLIYSQVPLTTRKFSQKQRVLQHSLVLV